MGIARLGEKVAAKATKTRAEAGAFHAAYKAAPGQTLGTYAKKHRWGIGLTAATMMPSPAHLMYNQRRSTHTGIDTKGQM